LFNFVTDGGNNFTISKGNFKEFSFEAILSINAHSGQLKVGSGPIEQNVLFSRLPHAQ
jgi:hypothetical protein